MTFKEDDITIRELREQNAMLQRQNLALLDFFNSTIDTVSPNSKERVSDRDVLQSWAYQYLKDRTLKNIFLSKIQKL